MAAKRAAAYELTHENWNQEDESEDAGVFKRASEDALKTRVIKTARRRITGNNSEGSSTVFNQSVLSSFGAKPKPANPFGFLSNLQSDPKSNGTDDKKSDEKETKTPMFNFGSGKVETKMPENKPEDAGNSKPLFASSTDLFKSNKSESNAAPMFKFGSSTESKPISNGFTFASSSDKNELDNSFYYGKLKGLNESVAKWINKHVEDNPLIDLKPIFRDYEKFFDEIEKSKTKTISIQESPKPTFNFVPTNSKSPAAEKTKEDTLIPTPVTSFKFGSTASFGSTNGGFSFSAPSFGSDKLNQVTEAKKEETKEDDEEPPKVEVKEVKEEGHIYTKKCKMFVKKDNGFVEKGIGSLFLKPVEDSEKVQVIIRAHNSLANILCNFILTKGIPTQRMGKNNVMLVCIPTPDAKPPPVPVLIRVKNAEEADELLEILDKHKK